MVKEWGPELTRGPYRYILISRQQVVERPKRNMCLLVKTDLVTLTRVLLSSVEWARLCLYRTTVKQRCACSYLL